jgi:hypothetical protein
MIDEGDCGAIGGMKIGRGNRRLGENDRPLPPRRFLVLISEGINK